MSHRSIKIKKWFDPIRSVLALARTTLLEWVRARLVVVIFFIGLCLLGLSPLVASLSFDQQLRILIHFGFFVSHISLNLLGLSLGATIIYRELEQNTLQMTLCHPVSRFEFLVGKLLGVLGLVFLSATIFFIFHGVLIWRNHVIFKSFLIVQITYLWESWVAAVLGFSFGLIFRPYLAFTLALTLIMGGHWLSDLRFFAVKSGSAFYGLLSKVLPYLVPHFGDWLHFRSSYVVTGEWRFEPGLLIFIQSGLLSLLVFMLASKIWSRRDLVA